MRTEVWQKLPPNMVLDDGTIEQPDEGLVIECASLAFMLAHQWQSSSNRLTGNARITHGPSRTHTEAELGRLARIVADDLASREEEQLWNRSWPSDRRLGPVDVARVLANTAEYYERRAAESAAIERKLPPIPRKRHSATAQQTWFARVMSRFMQIIFGRPCDSVVAALTSVAFDLPDGPTIETTRGRRRRPENYRSGPHYLE